MKKTKADKQATLKQEQPTQTEINEKALRETVEQHKAYKFPAMDVDQLKQFIKDATGIVELWDLCDYLWHVYFLNSKLDKPGKKKVMEVYNLAANAANKQAGEVRTVLLTASTVWQPKPGEEGKRVIGNAKPTELKKQPAPAAKAAPSGDKPKVAKQPGSGGSIIEQILAHYKNGKTRKEIVELGFNKSTVNRQVGEYEKKLKQSDGKA